MLVDATGLASRRCAETVETGLYVVMQRPFRPRAWSFVALKTCMARLRGLLQLLEYSHSGRDAIRFNE